MDNRPIGILDSGIGGLSIWKEIVRELPQESTIYIADSINCPYGNRGASQIYKLAKRLVQFLIGQNAKLVVVACNTVTVSCLGRLRTDFPEVPIVGTVPVVKKAAEQTKNRIIGVLSTRATAKSAYQKDLIEKFANGCRVVNVGTDELVALVETGKTNGFASDKILRRELTPFITERIDTLALGCSHFPFLREAMANILGPNVSILDSGGAIARQVGRVLTNNSMLASNPKLPHHFYTTDDVNQLRSIIKKLVGNSALENLTQVSL